MKLYDLAVQAGIATAPGQLFSPDRRSSHCVRLNVGHHEEVVLPSIRRFAEMAHHRQGLSK